MAHRQTEGRGRSGAGVASTATGNLMATLLFAPELPADRAASALAADRRCRPRCGCRSRRRAKALVCGSNGRTTSCCTRQARRHTRREHDVRRNSSVAAIGIGINIAHAPAVAGRSVASLDGCRLVADRSERAAGRPRRAVARIGSVSGRRRQFRSHPRRMARSCRADRRADHRPCGEMISCAGTYAGLATGRRIARKGS